MVALMWSTWKTENSKVFRDEIPNPMATLLRAKKANAEWCIRHKLTQSIQPPNQYSNHQANIDILDSMEEATRRIHQDQFGESKSSHQMSGGYVTRNWIGRLIQVGAFNMERHQSW